jgi:hypothetical protein
MTILPLTMTSSTNTPRLSMASTLKTACKYANDSMCNAEGKYGEYAKEAAFVKVGDNKLLATRAIGHVHCAR